ncbi:MAG: LCP family protein [Candidatus Fermentithermobacillus carboniphilus]|uniref:LCP family protein n=1 Tax=Candidatus Fermentithermobacillus carboniphilus TaxID=3085328 RepID=A0AAT9L9D0_9FIRM|nr:MAG: LCP family protein [Candidatus Fermentithermobacillus carboniphilus]
MRSRRSRHEPLQPDPVEETRIYHKDEVGRKPKRRWVKVLGILVFAVVLFFGGMAYGIFSYIKGYSPPGAADPQEFQKRLNILVLGIDGGVNGKLLKNQKTGTRSDVIILVSVDPETKAVGVLSIPRDTRVFIPSVNDLEKIGHAHAYGGPELAVRTVEEFLKVDIDRYVRIDFEGFKKVIDTLGGVEIDVPTRMDYDDPYQNLHIHLEPGRQVLDGEKALEFVRYRQYADGDIGRIKAQEQFLKALMDKVLRIATIPKIPSLIADIKPYVVTDLTNDDIMYLAKIGLSIKPENVKMGLVPGQPGYIAEVSYWLPDAQKTQEIVDELIRGIDREKYNNIKVVVQNGCGVQGAADYLASILRAQGFTVVSVGNAGRYDYPETKVLAPRSKSEAQALVLRSVKATCNEAKAYRSDEVPENADVLVIIGKDFKRQF